MLAASDASEDADACAGEWRGLLARLHLKRMRPMSGVDTSSFVPAAPAPKGFSCRLLEQRGRVHAEFGLCHTVGTACSDAPSHSVLRVDAVCAMRA